MQPLTTSTLILARLFAEPEGGMMASTPKMMLDLAERLMPEAELIGYSRASLYRDRWHFMIRPDAREAMADLRSIPEHLLRKDFVQLREMMRRIAASKWVTRPLKPEELGYLIDCIQDTGWARGIGVLDQEEMVG